MSGQLSFIFYAEIVFYALTNWQLILISSLCSVILYSVFLVIQARRHD